MADPVKSLRELLNNPEWRFASGIPQDAEIDESRLDELEAWRNEPVDPANLPADLSLRCLITRCLCGWFDYYSSSGESPSTCPRCSRDLVIRNNTDMDEIIYPVTTEN